MGVAEIENGTKIFWEILLFRPKIFLRLRLIHDLAAAAFCEVVPQAGDIHHKFFIISSHS